MDPFNLYILHIAWDGYVLYMKMRSLTCIVHFPKLAAADVSESLNVVLPTSGCDGCVECVM